MGNPFLLSSNERHQGVCKVHSSFVETICFLPYAGSIQPVLEMAAARQTRLGRVPACMFVQSPTKTDRRWPVAYQVAPISVVDILVACDIPCLQYLMFINVFDPVATKPSQGTWTSLLATLRLP